MIEYPIFLFSKNIINAFEYAPPMPSKPYKPSKPTEPILPTDYSALLYLIAIIFFVVFVFAFVKDNEQPFLTGFIGLMGMLIFGITGYLREKEIKEFPNKVFRYRKGLTEYSNDIIKYNNEIKEYELKKNKLQDIEHVLSLKIDYYYKSIRKYMQPSSMSIGDKNYIKGKSEHLFFIELKKQFNNYVFDNLFLTIYNIEYKPDYVYKDDLIIIDIEIDEPYEKENGMPIHFIGADDYRNNCFISSGWNIIRFAEEQIIKEPYNCICFVKTIISILRNREIDKAQELINENPLSRIQQWTKDEAHVMAYKKFRDKY